MWGLMDAEGRIIVSPVYSAIHCYRHGLAWAAIGAKRQWCPIDADGNIQERPACVTVKIEDMAGPIVEPLATDPFENSVLQTRGFHEFGIGARTQPPHSKLFRTHGF